MTTHDLAIKAIKGCIAANSYGSYKEAVEAMMPVYEAGPEMLDALERAVAILELSHIVNCDGTKTAAMRDIINKARNGK